MSKDDRRNPPKSRTQRFLKLAGMTASVAGGYAGNTVAGLFRGKEARTEARKERHAAAGMRIVQTLGELKGAAMKVGQMASWVNDLLPDEVASALTVLQKDAPPVDFSVIEGQIRRELGDGPEVLFRSFDPEPFASASLGQVHRAVTDDGREVVVKIQYPGVDDSVDADLAHFKLALKMAGLVRIQKDALERVFEEIRGRLHEELDYCLEADSVRRFRELYGHMEGVVIPQVVGERSSKRILTLTCELGDDLPSVMETYDQATKDAIGNRLVELLGLQLFVGRFWHADPNPANFAFRPDGTVIVYDFGCMKAYRKELTLAFRDVLASSLAGDWDTLDRSLITLGLRRPGTPRPDDGFYSGMAEAFFRPLIDQPDFDFSTSTVHLRINDYKSELIKRWRSLQPPSELVFLDRTIAGIYGMLLKLGCTVPFLGIMQRYMALAEEQPA